MGRLVGRVQGIARRHPFRFDSAIAAGASILSLLSAQDTAEYNRLNQLKQTASANAAAPTKMSALFVVAALMLGVPLAFRRKSPLLCALLAMAVTGFAFLVRTPESGLGFVVCWFAVHAIAAYATNESYVWGRRLVVAVVVLGLVISPVAFFRDELFTTSRFGSQVRTLVIATVFYLAAFATAWFTGLFSRTREQHVRLLAERARELEVQQADRARQAVFDERVRIAREVHDAVAHHVSVMGVQAGAARRMLAKQPDRVAAIIGGIEESSRSAVAELSKLVLFLRQPSDHDPAPSTNSSADAGLRVDEPQPDHNQLDSLLHEARSAGMQLVVNQSGDHQQLPASVSMCVYRIVQEALTNVRRHAGVSALTTVSLDYGRDGIDVEVVNRGQIGVTQPAAPRSGHGLIGMRERVALVSGELTVGPVPGGYRVHAWLPVERQPAAASA
jgi:signal transduction histidine kinase